MVRHRRTAGWLLVVLLLVPGCAPRRGYEAALVLADIAAGSEPSRLKQLTPTPGRQSIAFHVEGRSCQGDLYLPGERPRAGLLLIPGAAEEGKDDPRLTAFATTLARARFTVLVPDLTSLRRLQVNPGNINEIRDAFDWLASRPDLAPPERVGMIAFSYAAGPAILAALEAKIRDRVGFILAVGPYHDLEKVLTFFTTGYYWDGGEWRHGVPNVYGKWIFIQSNLGRLADPRDQTLFRAMGERKKVDPAADISALAHGLSPEGARLYAFVTNRDPARVPALINGLPAAIRADLAVLNLADKDLSRLHGRLLLVHGTDDPIIPFTESIALAKAMPAGHAQLFLAEGLAHVELRPGLLGRFRLWQALRALLAARDGQ